MSGSETIFIIDDDASVRRSLTHLLGCEGYGVEASPDPARLLGEGDPERGACLVLDLCLPGLSGLSIQEELARRGVVLPIVFISGHGDVPASVQAMKRGAADLLPKPVAEETLLAAVALAVERGRRERARRDELRAARARCATLTSRELEVAKRVSAGMLNKQIAVSLGTAEKTVATHRANAMRKLGVDSVAKLVRLLDKALGGGAAPAG